LSEGKGRIQLWIEDFHYKYHHHVDHFLDKETMLFRVRLIAEEFAELVKAMDLMDPIEIADALGDLEVVVNGTAVTFGFPLQAIVAEIHESNMTKGDNVDGKPKKGPEFKPPDILAVLKKYWPQIEEYGR
jgi:Phosphoribosyl-ATP pyrophosphohydrolase